MPTMYHKPDGAVLSIHFHARFHKVEFPPCRFQKRHTKALNRTPKHPVTLSQNMKQLERVCRRPPQTSRTPLKCSKQLGVVPCW